MIQKQLKITQIKSKYGRLVNHKKCLVGLGIRKLHQTKIVADTPENRGMILKVSYMLKIEEL